MSDETKTESGLVDQILAFLKGNGDKRVIARVVKRSKRILSQTIADAEREIESLEDDVVDAQVRVDESYLYVDIETAKDNIDSYSIKWLDNIKAEAAKLEALKEDLSHQQDILAAAKDLSSRISK